MVAAQRGGMGVVPHLDNRSRRRREGGNWQRRGFRPGLSALAVLFGCVLTLAGCAGSPQVGGTQSPGASDTAMAAGSSPAGASGDLVVFAAASLTQVFNQIAGDFEASHPGVKISLQFDGSSTLARQIVEGAPADVFVSADQTTMDTVVSAGLIVKPVDFTSNSLVLAVPAGNPAGITSIDDLADPAVALLVCAPDVPCGSIATRICDAAGLTVSPVSQEPNVSAVVTKLELGEADAGFVYSTDVAASDGQLVAIDLPAALTGLASTTYPLGIVQTSANPQLAEEFTAYLLGDDAREILAQAGFGAV